MEEKPVESIASRMKSLQEANTAKDAKLSELETITNLLAKNFQVLRNPPYCYFCASAYGSFKLTEATISYPKQFLSSTNVDGASLDISTGIFTAGYPGVYTVTWSLNVWWGGGDHRTYIDLLKNGKEIQEAEHESSGAANEQGGRTLILHLDRGDTLALYCTDCSYHCHGYVLCLSWTVGYSTTGVLRI